MKFVKAFIFLLVFLHVSASYSCIASLESIASRSDLESLDKAKQPDTALIGTVVFYVDDFKHKNAPISGATPVFKVLKGFSSAVAGELLTGVAGASCSGLPLARLGDFYIYRTSEKSAKLSQKLILNSKDFAAYDYIKKNFDIDLNTVDKSVTLSSRIKFEIKRNSTYLPFGVIGAISASILIYRRKKSKRGA